jgi:hypothetical protein
MPIENSRWPPPHFEFHIGTKNVKFVEDHPMYTHMDSLALIIFVVSEKKAFEHFLIGSNVNLCIAVAAISPQDID